MEQGNGMYDESIPVDSSDSDHESVPGKPMPKLVQFRIQASGKADQDLEAQLSAEPLPELLRQGRLNRPDQMGTSSRDLSRSPVSGGTARAHANSNHAKEPICKRLSNYIFFTEQLPDVEKVMRETSLMCKQNLFRIRAVNYLPTWAYEEEPLNHPEAADMWGTDHARTLCFAGTALIWMFFVTFSFVAWTFSVCDESGLVVVPNWLIRIYPPFLLLHVYLEWKVLRYIVVAQAMYTAPFQLGPFKVQYVTWLLVSLSMSIVGHMDITTSGIVIAKAFKSGDCRAAHFWNPSEVWKQTVDQSFMSFVPCLSNLAIVFLFSGGMLACQPAYSLLCAIPLGRQDGPFFDTCLQSQQTVPGSVIQLAELNRMAAITIQDAQYLARASKDWKPGVICGHLQRTITKFVLISIFEGAIQTNLQASLKGVNTAVEVLHHNIDNDDYLILGSFILSCSFALYGLLQTHQKVSMLYASLKSAASLIGVGGLSDAPAYESIKGARVEKAPTFHQTLTQAQERFDRPQGRTALQELAVYRPPGCESIYKAVVMCLNDSGRDIQYSYVPGQHRRDDFPTLLVSLRAVKPSDLSEEFKTKLRSMLNSGELDPQSLRKKSAVLSAAGQYLADLLQIADADEYEQKLIEYDAQCEILREDAQRNFSKGRVLYMSFFVVASFYVALLAYAVIKVGMVSKCKYGVWNPRGCVDFDDAKAYSASA